MVFLDWLVMEWLVMARSCAVAWETGSQLWPLGSLASAAVVQGQLESCRPSLQDLCFL